MGLAKKILAAIALALVFVRSAWGATTAYDFETLTNCTTGRESTCQSDNGIAFSTSSGADESKAFRIGTPASFGIANAAVGNAAVCGSGLSGGSGPGYFDEPFVSNATSACLGYYVMFGPGWMQNISSTGNHGPALKFDSGTGCAGYVSIDHALSNPRIIVEINGATCGSNSPTGSGANLTMNVGSWLAKNNQWYHVEICSSMNTTATSTNIQGGGDGVVSMYVDGSKVLEYTNLNIRGSSSVAYSSFFGARAYMGLGTLAHTPNICFDYITLKDGSTTPVGPNGSANSAGTGDGPYFMAVGADGMEGRKRNLDCEASSTGTTYISSAWSEDWKSGKSLVEAPDHNEYQCNHSRGNCDGLSGRSDCNTNKSLAATTAAANAGAGVYYSAGDTLSSVTTTTADGIYMHGWIYLDNLPSVSMAFAGIAKCTSFNCSTGGSSVNNFLALTVSSGKWGLLPKTSGTVGTAHESAVSAVADTWTEFELAVSDANKCSLAINKQWVLDEVTCNQSISTWAFSGSDFGFLVFGTIDSRTESSSFTVNYDDVDAGGASFWNCKGWTKCPFGGSATLSSFGIVDPL